MAMGPYLCAAVAVLVPICHGASSAFAQPQPPTVSSRVGSMVLPTRSEQRPQLSAKTRAVAAVIADRIGSQATPLDDGDDPSLRDVFTRADELYAAGSLDAAAAAYDIALPIARRRPHRIGDPLSLIEALVARTTIALARNEKVLANQLLVELLTYDPTFELTPSEQRPSLSRALDAVKSGGDLPAPTAALLGSACSEAGIVIASRPSASGMELFRFDSCKLVATIAATQLRDAGELATALGTAPKIVIPPPPPPPLYKRPWFWGATLVAVGTTIGLTVFFVTRDTDGFDVVPHF